MSMNVIFIIMADDCFENRHQAHKKILIVPHSRNPETRQFEAGWIAVKCLL